MPTTNITTQNTIDQLPVAQDELGKTDHQELPRAGTSSAER